MKIFVAHSSMFDFINKLYIPLWGSRLNTLHDIFLPQENGHEEVTKELIKSCDLVIAEVSMPSTGAGIELGWQIYMSFLFFAFMNITLRS